MPSVTDSAPRPRLMSTCGWACSSRIFGEFGYSSDRSFRYMRWIWNTGVLLSSAMMSRSQSKARDRDGAGCGGRNYRRAMRRASVLREQGREAAALVERDQVVAAAHVMLADEALRHGAPPGDLHHVLALGRVQVDADLLDGVDAALLEQRLGVQAVGAHQGRIHLHFCHAYFFRVRPGDVSARSFQ